MRSVGLTGDAGVQTVSPQVTVSHPPGGRLPLLSARPAVTFPAAEHHRPLASTKLCSLVTKAHRCEQLAQGRYRLRPGICHCGLAAEISGQLQISIHHSNGAP